VQRAHERLSSLVTALQRRDGELTLLSRLNDLLQTCETQEEAYRIIPLMAAELFSGQAGCLAVFRASGQYLETVARWGDEALVENVFPMKDCWAIRRGRPHEVVDPETSLRCDHFVRPPEQGYLCIPLTVQGETLGVFHLVAAPPSKDDHHVNQRQLAVTVGETIKLSLANLKLRKTLHEQATRDPLTGLFNRRYLEDTLPRELHRALRRDAHTCLAMIDLDHFKRFNDTFGHEAGDLILRETGRLLREHLRKSDIACRYGGEEFVIVLPDSTLEDASKRLEQVRILFEKLEVRHGGQLMATITGSAGIAAAPEHGTTMEELLRAADSALYAAKHAGRNCIATYQPQG
jgi:diguanylate cyclase (GGDEF)-like protein